MKKLLYLGLITVVALLYFYPFPPDSSLYSIHSNLRSIGNSEADYRQALKEKQNELNNYEEMIDKITTQFEKTAASAPICSITGQQIEIKMDNDPRPELRVKCEALLAEIEAIEEKLY